ncbi:MAG: hypothetical protein NC433_08035 [Clostridiales bacterium]|nr:hypothetical protein [Clostridiales bacterium]
MVNISNMPIDLAKELAFSEEEMEELKIAREKAIVFDEDCPETTPERAMKFRRVNPPRNNSVKRA